MSLYSSSSEEQELTTKDKAEQLAFRQALHKAAISDAYATAVAYQTNKTKETTERNKTIERIERKRHFLINRKIIY